MQSTRVELEQKLRVEREAVAAAARRQTEQLEEAAQLQADIAAASAQKQASLTAEILLSRDREKSALLEAERTALEMRDAMAKAHAAQAQLLRLENSACEYAALEDRLALELEHLQHKSLDLQAHKISVESGPPSPDAATAHDASLLNFPHDLELRISAVLENVSAHGSGWSCCAVLCGVLLC
jgi:hypothetical protein